MKSRIQLVTKKIKVRTWVALILVLLLGAVALVASRNPSGVNAVWPNYDWSYRKTITILGSQVVGSTNLTNFPVLISLVDGDLSSNAQADADDVIFIDSSGTQLAHEVERYDSGTGTLVVWILIPTLYADADTTVYMYYGNSGASNTEDPDTVWADYEAVYHFSGDVTDSTSNNRDGTDNGTADTDGKIGKARDFEDSESDYIDIGTWSVSGDQMTTQFWVQFNAFPASTDGRVISKANSSATEGHVIMLGYTDNGSYDIRTRIKTGTSDGSGTSTVIGDSNWTTGTWYHAAVTYDGSNIRLFVNGNQSTFSAKTGNLRENTWSWNIGRNPGSNDSYVDAIIDEPRVANVARSEDWLETEYNNQNTPSNFYNVSAEESAPAEVTGVIELYFPFNEESGSTVYDTSGAGGSGTISGATRTDPSMCKFYFCLSFDGSDDVVTSGNHVGISFQDDLAAAHTFMTWIRPLSDGESNVGQIFSKGNTYMRTTNQGSDGLMDLEVSLDLTTSDATVTVTDALKIGDWTHVAFGYTDDGDDEITVYINGQPRGTSSNGSGTPITTDTNPLLIGGSTGANYHGYIDDFKIYSVERTATELASDMISENAEGASVAFGTDPYSFLSKSLIAHWKIDEGTGTNIADSSGSGYTGTASGITWNSGKYHMSAEYVGGEDDYITMGDVLDLEYNGTFTIAAWIYPTSVSAAIDTIVSKQNSSSPFTGWKLDHASNDLRFDYLTTNTTNELLAVTTSNPIHTANRWYHVVMTYNNKHVNFYVNGVKHETTYSRNTLTSSTNNTIPLNIGNRNNGASLTEDFNGRIDEVRIYNREFSGSEAQRLYNWAPGPFLHYRMDEGSGTTTVSDVSGNGNDGEMNGFSQSDWVAGKYGNALYFDGTDTAIDMYSANMAADFNGNRGSIMAWVKVANSGVWTDGTFRNILYAVPNNTDRFNISRHSSNNSIDFYYRTNGSDILYGATTVTPTTDWFHVALTWDTLTDEVFAYVNGQEVDSASGTASPWVTPLLDEWTTIGAARSDFPSQMWNGYVDDVRFYNYPRTVGQIVEDMNAGHPLGGSPIGSQTLYWKFDEQNGSTANSDISSGTDGTISNALWRTKSNCKINGCLFFDGAGDVVTIPTASDEDVDFSTTDQFSGSAWVYSTTMPGSGQQDAIIAKWDQTSSQRGYRIYLENDDADATGNFEVQIYDNSAGQSITASAPNDTALQDTWYHVAFTFNGGTSGTAGDLILYVNGKSYSSSTNASFAGLESVTSDFTVGEYDTNDAVAANTGFTGYIDDVKVYSAALSPEQIRIDMNANATVNIGTTANAEDVYLEGGAGNPPIGYWSFDENTGTAVADKSGNSNTGTSDSSSWSPGKYGSSISLSGSGQSVAVANETNFDFERTDDFSISAWVKTSYSGGDQVIVSKMVHSAPYRGYNVLVQSTGDVLLQMVNTWSSNVLQIDSIRTVNDGNWHHILVTYDGSSSAAGAKIYIDGIEDDVDVDYDTLSSTILNDTAVQLGSRNDTHYYFNGNLDEIKIWDYDLNPQQAAYEYNRGAPIAHWKFDECSGASVYDASGNSMTGTIQPGDASGSNDSVGTCSGSAGEMRADGADGKYNASIEFDGTNDYIDLGNPVKLRYFPTITVSAWVYGDPFAGSNTHTVFYNDTSGFYLSVTDRKIRFRSSDLTSDITDGVTELSDNQWHHIAATYDGATVRLYLNGKLDNSEAATGVLEENTLDAIIGAFGTSSLFFDGKIDDVRIYSYALSQSQISRLYNANDSVKFDQ